MRATEQVLSYEYRLLPTRKQHEALRSILEEQRILYNAALQERIDCYRKTGKGRTLYDQFKALTQLRQDPEYSAVPLKLQRGTLARLDEAFKGFFRRIKAGDKPGFPRFKGRGWFSSFEFDEFSGITYDGKRFRFKGMPGGIRVHLHRPLPSDDIRSAKFKRDTKGWHICLAVRVKVSSARVTKRSVGIDMGISTLAMLSSGEAIPNPRVARSAEKEMRVTQRALARCKRGSNRRKKIRERLARLHGRIARTRRTYLHQVSAKLVQDYDLIAVENLKVKALAGGMLARDVHDAGWSTLKEMLRYKAERAGAKLIAVDPRNTSQECSGCGVVVRKRLGQRTHSCPECGLVLDRDENAARNILARGRSGSRVPQDRAA